MSTQLVHEVTRIPGQMQWTKPRAGEARDGVEAGETSSFLVLGKLEKNLVKKWQRCAVMCVTAVGAMMMLPAPKTSGCWFVMQLPLTPNFSAQN